MSYEKITKKELIDKIKDRDEALILVCFLGVLIMLISGFIIWNTKYYDGKYDASPNHYVVEAFVYKTENIVDDSLQTRVYFNCPQLEMVLYYDFDYPEDDYIEGRTVKIYLIKTEDIYHIDYGRVINENKRTRIEVNEIRYKITGVEINE